MPVPSASDLSRQHLDADNFARLFDDTLSAATAQGRNKPALDSKAAQERFLDLAKQVQGMALTNKDNEELKILGDLASSFTSNKPYGAQLGMFRKRFSNWKKEKDNWYRTAQEKSQLKEEIENTFSAVEKEADKSKQELDSQAGELKDVAKADDLKDFDNVSSGLKSVMAGHKRKIDSIKRELADKNLTINDLQKLKSQLDQEITKAKTEREKFKKESNQLYEKITGRPEPKAEVAEAEEEEAEKPKAEIEEEVKTSEQEKKDKKEKRLDGLISERQEIKSQHEKISDERRRVLESLAFKHPEYEMRKSEYDEQLRRLEEQFDGITEKIEKKTGVNLTEAENLLMRRNSEIERKAAAQRNAELAGANVDPQFKNLVSQIRGLEREIDTNSSNSDAFHQLAELNSERIKLEEGHPERRAYERQTWSVSDADNELSNIDNLLKEMFGADPDSLTDFPIGDIQTAKQLLKIKSQQQVSVSAEVTPPSASAGTSVTVEGKLERAAAARNIPMTAEVAAAATVTAAVAAGATQAVAWMTAHQSLTPEQTVVQAQQEILSRTARETETSFTSREELARTKAENVGFSRGITQGMEARGQQTSDQKWTKAAADVGKFAEQTARQAPQTLEMPGAKAPAGGAFWQPEELEAIDQAWDGIAAQAIRPPLPTAPETQAPSAPAGRVEAPDLGAEPAAGRPRVPRPTPRVTTATPRAERLPPGVTLAKEPMRLPPSQPGSRRAQGGVPVEGVGGDTQVSDQSIGFGDERTRPSVLEQSVPLSAGSFAQGEEVGQPIAGGGELELPETTGGGIFGEAQRAAELESQRSREKMRAAESLIPGAAGPAVAGALGSETQVGTEQPSPEEEDGAGEEQEARGETKGGGALEQGRQMIEDKMKEKIEKEVKQQAEKAMKKVFQKTTQQAASGGVRVTTEVAEGVTSEFILPLIIMIVQMNIQLFLKYILAAGKTMGVDVAEVTEDQLGDQASKSANVMQSFLEQSFPEDLLTIFLDCNLMCMTNPCCWVLLVVLMVVFLIIAGLDQDVQGLVGNLFDAF